MSEEKYIGDEEIKEIRKNLEDSTNHCAYSQSGRQDENMVALLATRDAVIAKIETWKKEYCQETCFVNTCLEDNIPCSCGWYFDTILNLLHNPNKVLE